MADFTTSVAYGTAVVGYDLMLNRPEAREPNARVLKGIALTGGGAAGDCGIELFINGIRKGTYYNTGTTLAAKENEDIKILNEYVPANAQVECKVTDAAPSGTMNVLLRFDRPQGRSTGFRRPFRSTGGTSRGRTTRRRTGMF